MKKGKPLETEIKVREAETKSHTHLNTLLFSMSSINDIVTALALRTQNKACS